MAWGERVAWGDGMGPAPISVWRRCLRGRRGGAVALGEVSGGLEAFPVETRDLPHVASASSGGVADGVGDGGSEKFFCASWMAEALFFEGAIVISEEKDFGIFFQASPFEVGEDVIGGLLACKHGVEEGKRFTIEAWIGEHFCAGALDAIDGDLSEKLPDAIFAIASIVGVILFELASGFGETADEVVSDSESPVFGIFAGIEGDHFFEVSDGLGEIAEEESGVAAIGVGANGAGIATDGQLAFEELLLKF